MSYLLCLSPILLDQSFPRNEEELRIVASALGELELFVSCDTSKLVITQTLSDFIIDFDWASINLNLLTEIYRLLSQLLLRQDDRVISMNKYLDCINNYPNSTYYPHPLPMRCENQTGLLGKL